MTTLLVALGYTALAIAFAIDNLERAAAWARREWLMARTLRR